MWLWSVPISSFLSSGGFANTAQGVGQYYLWFQCPKTLVSSKQETWGWGELQRRESGSGKVSVLHTDHSATSATTLRALPEKRQRNPAKLHSLGVSDVSFCFWYLINIDMLVFMEFISAIFILSFSFLHPGLRSYSLNLGRNSPNISSFNIHAYLYLNFICFSFKKSVSFSTWPLQRMTGMGLWAQRVKEQNVECCNLI